jgi:hypothetical protein
MEKTTINEKIEWIGQFPHQLGKVLKKLSDEQLDTPYRDDGWTIRQVVHHLADAHMNGYVRMKLLFTEDVPILKTYQQEQWADLTDAKELPVIHSLKVLEGLHFRWERFLNTLEKEDWDIKGVHPEIGEVSLHDLLNVYTKHCHSHLGQIIQLCERMGW